jgi:hypothetical protein
MLFWPAAIAWRRFLQGVMIHFGHTRKVALGTAIRLAASAGAALLLALMTDWAGVIIGSTSLMVGVLAEAAYATVAVRPLLQIYCPPSIAESQNDEHALTYRELFWFHLPLAATSVLILFAQPLVTFSLARLDQPTLSLAAWPVIFQLMLLSRAAAFAWPEVVIALSDGPRTFAPLRRFTVNMAILLTLLLATFVLSPLADWYIYVLQDMTTVVGELAQSNLILFLFFPGLTAFICWLRGLLIKQRMTKEVNRGMILNLLVTVLVLAIGLAFEWRGLATAALALNVAAIVEVLYLGIRTQRLVVPETRLLGYRLPALGTRQG